MNAKTCCIAGHCEIQIDKQEHVGHVLRNEIAQAILDGYTHFISGFSKGADLLFASALADFMTENPALTLEAAIPYRNQLKATNVLSRRLLQKCSVVGIHQEAYSPSCFVNRDRFLVSQSQRIIIVYDNKYKWGTFQTLQYARLRNRDVRVIKI